MHPIDIVIVVTAIAVAVLLVSACFSIHRRVTAPSRLARRRRAMRRRHRDLRRRVS